MGEWSQAGAILSVKSARPWFAALAEEDWPDDPQIRAEIRAEFVEPTGDRRNEIVFIGTFTGNDKEDISRALDACLVTDEELAASQNDEVMLEDPFEAWDLGGYVEEEEEEDMEEDKEGGENKSDEGQTDDSNE